MLLEAGEMYLRGGGEVERALGAFREARRVAERAAPELVSRAERGLFVTYVMEGDQRVGAFTSQAIESYARALEHAQEPSERVAARIRIHRALAGGEPGARIANLTALVAEAEDVVARFDDEVGDLPARAAGLFLLAREELGRDRPEAAVTALQRVLLEARTMTMPAGEAGEVAREQIEVILETAGRAAFAPHEARARALLAEAQGSGDAALIERLLVEYPNATVITEALLERGRGLLAQAKPLEAAPYLQRLLRTTPADHALLPTALAALARAYRLSGARGAALAALTRLEGGYAEATVLWDDETWTGTSFATAERAFLTGPAVEDTVASTLNAPLEEVHFEPVGDEEMARAVLVVTATLPSGAPADAPVALMARGQELVAFDLRSGRVAWTQDTGGVQHAAYADGVLILALTRELRGLDVLTGKLRWALPTDALTRTIAVGGGLAFAHLQDVSRGSNGAQRLDAIDVAQGTSVWSQALGVSDYRGLEAVGSHVILQQVDYRASVARSRLLVFQAFDGARRHVLPFPVVAEGVPTVADGLYLVAGRPGPREPRVLLALDIDRGRERWRTQLPPADSLCALARDGDNIVALLSDGGLASYALATGEPGPATRLYVADRGTACPFPQTAMLAADERITMIPWSRRPAFGVVCFDRRTGKLVWDSTYDPTISPSKAVLVRRGRVLCSLVSYPRNRVQTILVRLIDAETGKTLQEIEPDGLSQENWIPSMVEGHGTVVIYGKKGASLFR